MSGRAVFLWVVIPFVTLSALALWLTRDTSPPPPRVASAPAPPPPALETPPPAPRPSPERPPTAAPVAPTPAPPAPPEPVPEEDPLPEPPPGTWTREEVRAALDSVMPLIRECLQDASLRHVGPQKVRMRFTLEAQQGRGRFKRNEVVESTLQDPFVFACLQDTLDEAHFSAPVDRAPLTLTQPFQYRPRKKAVP